MSYPRPAGACPPHAGRDGTDGALPPHLRGSSSAPADEAPAAAKRGAKKHARSDDFGSDSSSWSLLRRARTSGQTTALLRLSTAPSLPVTGPG
eukprot:201693-Chlamydomonas_euryale.AAC.1